MSKVCSESRDFVNEMHGNAFKFSLCHYLKNGDWTTNKQTEKICYKTVVLFSWSREK